MQTFLTLEYEQETALPSEFDNDVRTPESYVRHFLTEYSPPYMVEGMETDPFENYGGESDYESYLANVADVFGQLRSLVAPDAHVLVDVSNMKYEGEVTTLAWDVAEAVSESFHFEGEVVVGWDGEKREDRDGGTYGYGYDHSYCLVFRNA